MAGRLENQMLQQRCGGVDTPQASDRLAQQQQHHHHHHHHHHQHQQQELQEPNIKCTSDTSGALYPTRSISAGSTAGSTSAYYSTKYHPQAGEYAPRLVGTYPTAQAQWGSMDGTKSPQHRGGDYTAHHQFSMSGGPPQHPHGRQAPPNSAWNHLQVPNFYPARQPQHAHMSNEMPLLATPTWHTPTTTEPSKGGLSHSPLFNLQQMLGTERPYPRHSPGVDLTLTRNGSSSQNGDLPQTPISLSVRDTKQINSLPVGAALDGDRAVELTKGPSPDCQPSPKNIRRPATKRMDSIIDRLNTNTSEKQLPQSVIVTAASSSHDENSNSSQGTAIASAPTPTPTLVRDDDVSSPVSNEDSLDSNKSRRKRKPSKTMKVAKDEDLIVSAAAAVVAAVELEKCEKLPPVIVDLPVPPPEPVPQVIEPPRVEPEVVKPSPARRRSSSEPPPSPTSASKSRRKTVSESETIDNIAAMVAATTAAEVPEVKVQPPLEALTPVVQPVVEPMQEQAVQPAIVPSSQPVSQPAEVQITTSVVSGSVGVGGEQALEAVPVAKPVSVITRDHSNCSSDTVLNQSSVNNAVSKQEPLPVQCNTASPSEHKATDPAETSAAPQLVTLAQKQTGGDTECFVAVEDELEKMFAGIADAELSGQPDGDPLAVASTSQNLTLDNVSSTSNDVSATAGSSGSKTSNSHKRGRPKGSKNNSRRPSESNSTDSTPRKKHKASKKYDELDEVRAKLIGQQSSSGKSKKSKKSAAGKLQLNNKPDVVKDVYSYDSGSNASSSRSKGPFIQIKGPRDSPISVNIVNTPCHEDDPDKPGKQLKNKKFHDDSEYRHKVRSKGLHCSTLSNKYDAQTRDASWICVFCKRGPHATDPDLPGPSPFTLDTPQYSPGDLFGPYIITTDCPEYQRRSDDPFDAQFKSKKSAQTSTAALQQYCTMSPGELGKNSHGKKSKKRQNSESSLRDSIESTEVSTRDIMFGIAEVTPTSYEVWAHEDCVIWGPGVYLVGPKIMGLEGAVWGACAVPCRRCGLKGAAVCCLKRGCGSVMHIGCAKLSHWQLDELNYKAHCTEHSLNLP